MPTYVYETTDASKPRRTFEIKQSMREAALMQDPETGEPIVRVITGGYGYVAKGTATRAVQSPAPRQACSSGCGCH